MPKPWTLEQLSHTLIPHNNGCYPQSNNTMRHHTAHTGITQPTQASHSPHRHRHHLSILRGSIPYYTILYHTITYNNVLYHTVPLAQHSLPCQHQQERFKFKDSLIIIMTDMTDDSPVIHCCGGLPSPLLGGVPRVQVDHNGAPQGVRHRPAPACARG